MIGFIFYDYFGNFTDISAAGNQDIVQAVEDDNYDWGENVIALIEVDGTSIKYPIAQAKDNAWYLRRDINGNYSAAGSIFLDYRNSNDFGDGYNLIYGHRMSQGRMFSDIKKFFDLEFFNKNKKAEIKTKTKTINLEVAAIAKVEVFGEFYDFEERRVSTNDENLKKVYEKAAHKRRGDYGRLFVLSTCDQDSQRYRNILVLGEVGL